MSPIQLGDQAVLEELVDAFDPALGLRGMGGDEGDAQFMQGSFKLGGGEFAGQLFFHGWLAAVLYLEDAVFVGIDAGKQAVALDDLFGESEVAIGGFGEFEAGPGIIGSVINGDQETEFWAPTGEPVVGAAVKLYRRRSLFWAFGSGVSVIFAGVSALSRGRGGSS